MNTMYDYDKGIIYNKFTEDFIIQDYLPCMQFNTRFQEWDSKTLKMM